MDMSRREAVTALAAGCAVVAASAKVAWADGKTQSAPRVAPGKHAVTPLPFDPRKLKGLSEKLIRSHHDNNYAGAVKNLNKVEEALAKVGKQTEGYVVSGLKERELTFTNSITLHELYFENLGGDGKPAGEIARTIAQTFGSLGRFEELFRATGMSLAGGSGWTALCLNHHTGMLQTYWSSNHTQAVAFGQPLLLMDMYEHAFQMDYGAAAAKYVDAFFANINWRAVDARYAGALRVMKALRRA